MSARADSAELTLERIVDAMLHRFATTPYERIRLDDIAADAGVTVQTVIRRFGGKAPLLCVVVERELGRIAAARAAAARASAAETVAALVEHYEVYGDLILKAYAEAPLVEGLPALTERGREYHVHWCRQVFEPRLAPGLDEATLAVRRAQVVAICDATTWRILRRDGALGPAGVERAISELLAPLLAEWPGGGA
jgi:AcrR family transcriptional regulator